MHEGKSVLEEALKDMELVIASVHRGPGKMETDREDSAANTQMYMKVLGNSKVNVLGHVGRSATGLKCFRLSGRREGSGRHWKSMKHLSGSVSR